MQLLTTTLTILSLSTAALGCTRHTIQFKSAKATCTDGAAPFNTGCGAIRETIKTFSANNENIYGQALTSQFTGCDSCTAVDPRCYCTVTAWRFREWQTTSNTFDLGDWEISNNWTPLDSKTVDCD
ncbi:hypothetical protein GTA08_BOTSDO07337 [Botryosphaeria dothidea]|uniref:Avirulence Effector AvrLm4-7 domain-containing protein n=1 Tax=Botryosphaeria dothidea TaxID=55169 RepID=A0A8H4N713_9PEZI|nr:hypothetical protein GTA08_BOTSDO11530 [Botryosphaeria dothidea]KAF4305097.1 hypothetical protein GTA08_BOTSDO07337 [Botryosphaeria dothidea]